MLARFAGCLESICWVLAHNDDHNAPGWLRRWCERWQCFWFWAGVAARGELPQTVIDGSGTDPREQPWLGRVVLRLAAWPTNAPTPRAAVWPARVTV